MAGILQLKHWTPDMFRVLVNYSLSLGRAFQGMANLIGVNHLNMVRVMYIYVPAYPEAQAQSGWLVNLRAFPGRISNKKSKYI